MATIANKTRFFEGANLGTVVAVPVLFAFSLIFYGKLVAIFQPLGILIEDVYTYVFNLFAIQLGALLALFGLFACRPTPFLERMKNTTVFTAIVTHTNITLLVAVVAIAFTFSLGIVRFMPEITLTKHSVVFLTWAWVSVAATIIYARTIRLIMLALQ